MQNVRPAVTSTAAQAYEEGNQNRIAEGSPVGAPGGETSPSIDEPGCEPTTEQLWRIMAALEDTVGKIWDEWEPKATELCARLDKIQWMDVGDGNFNSTQYLKIVDTFRKAAKLSEQLKKEAQRNGTSTAAHENLPRLFTELKRFHLSHAAPTLIKEGAYREIARLPRSVQQGLEHHVTGTQLTGESKLSGKVVFGKVVQAGPEGELTSKRTFAANEEGDILYMKERGGGLKGTVSCGTDGPVSANGSAELGGAGAWETMTVAHDLETAQIHRLNDRCSSKKNVVGWTKSAAPLVRKSYHFIRKGENVPGKLVGLSGHDENAPLYLTTSKISKGIANQRKILSLAEKIGDPQLIDSIKQVYQPIADCLHTRIKNSNNVPLNLPRNIVTEVYPLAAAAVSRLSGNVKGKIGGGVTVTGPKKKGVKVIGDVGADPIGFSASAAQTSQGDKFHLEIPMTIHMRLSPETTKSISTSRRLLNQVIESYPEDIKRQTVAQLAQGRAETFEEIANRLCALRDKYIKFIKYENDDRLYDINRLVWGNNYDLNHLRSNEDKFIAQSYGEFSLGLGKLGVELAELKQKTAKNRMLDDAAKARFLSESQTADTLYDDTKNILEKKYLKRTDHDLLRYSSLQSAGSWRRSLGAIELTALLPAFGSAGDYKPAQGNVQYTATDYQLNHHPDITRRGNYREVKVKGGMESVSILSRPPDKSSSVYDGILSSDTFGGQTTTYIYRQPAEDRTGVPRKEMLQFVKVTDSGKTGLLFKPKIPTLPIGGGGVFGWTESKETIVNAWLGNDILFHILQYNNLKMNFIDHLTKDKDTHDYFSVFSGKTDTDRNRRQNNEIMNLYFNNSIVLDIVRSFEKFAAEVRESSPKRAISEFWRFEKLFKTKVEDPLAAEHFAPGSKKDIFAEVPRNLLEDLREWFDKQNLPLYEIKQQLRQSSTPEARMKLLCQRREQGASVFDAYLKIMETYKKLTDGSLFHNLETICPADRAIPWVRTPWDLDQEDREGTGNLDPRRAQPRR
ncbi:hypothetical protein [Brucella sp. IR073]|uniref:hypothetical protein n=1 Tax=unclassified Brucella TaxID=2632610 RepID=UPI003B986BBD